MNAGMTNIIEIEDLVKTYYVGMSEVRALRGVSLTVKPGGSKSPPTITDSRSTPTLWTRTSFS